MCTDTTQIGESLVELVNYNWHDEMKHFEETYDVTIQSQDDIDDWIKWCEQSEAKHHIFYHLMIIKSAHPDMFTCRD